MKKNSTSPILGVIALALLCTSALVGAAHVLAQSTPSYDTIRGYNDILIRNDAKAGLVQIAQTRQSAIQSYCTDNTASCLKLMIPPQTKKLLAPAVKSYIEDLVMIDGTIEKMYEDDGSPSGGSVHVFLLLDDGTKLEIRSVVDIAAKTQPKTRVRVTGFRIGRIIATSGTPVKYNPQKRSLSINDASGGIETVSPPPSPTPVSGKVKVLVLPFLFSGAQGDFNLQTLAQGYFAKTGDSVNTYYDRSSNGKVQIVGDVYTSSYLNINYANCGYYCGDYLDKISALVDEQAVKKGINLAAYDKIVYFSGTRIKSCPNGWKYCFRGWGQVGDIRAWDFGTDNITLQAHEIGHTLGMSHANTLSCPGNGIAPYTLCIRDYYGETTDIMGAPNIEKFNRSFTLNAPHLVELGWIDRAQIIDVTVSGEYKIAPAENGSSLPRVLRIRKPDTNGYYIVSWRAQLGKSPVHIWADNYDGAGSYVADTQLLNWQLTNGANFYDPLNKIKITQLSAVNGIITYKVELPDSTYDYNNDGVVADVSLLLKIVSSSSACPSGKICDVNGDGNIDISDVIKLNLRYDYNADGKVDIADAGYLIQIGKGNATCPANKICDTNNDGQINTTDVNIVLEMIKTLDLERMVSIVDTKSQTASALNATNDTVATTVPISQSGLKYTWDRNLEIGSPYTEDVTSLQKALVLEGVYVGDITGGFYSKTYFAVKKFQQKYGIEDTGYVGPLTRSKLNTLY